MANTIPEILSAKSKPIDGGCIVWMAAKTSVGYGVFRHKGKIYAAHRAAYVARHGEIGEGFHVLHSCDVRSCINHEHLFVGTNAANMQDRNRKNRQACGERDGNSKLIDVFVKFIKTSGLQRLELAQEFGVHISTIDRIRNKQIWRHI